jgi:hypothetical protein
VIEILLWTLVIAVPAALVALLLEVAGVLPRPRRRDRDL